MTDNRTFGVFQDIEQIIYAELRANDMDWQPSDKLRFKAEVYEVFRCDVLEILGFRVIGLADNLSIEADFALMHAFLDNICHTRERTADDEKDVPCVDNLFLDLAAFLKFHSSTHL